MVRISGLEPDRRAQHYMAFSVSGWEAADARVPRLHHGAGRPRSERVDLRCNDESEAIELAKQLVDGHDVELWQLDRQIRTFKAHGLAR